VGRGGCWVRGFKDGELGQADLSDKTRSGRPATASDQLNQDHVEELIRGSFVENNYAALKIIDVRIFLFFISLKFLFPFIFYLSGGKTYQPALIFHLHLLTFQITSDTLTFSRVEIFCTFFVTHCYSALQLCQIMQPASYTIRFTNMFTIKPLLHVPAFSALFRDNIKYHTVLKNIKYL
jgi:hypothetical protein